ncbi:uncharacterized protein LOC144330328 isoform X2 [Macaca mulatta]
MATGQSQPRLPPLDDRTPGSCPRAALVGPAYPHPPPDRVALSHRLETRDPRPGPAPRSCSSGLRFGAGFKTLDNPEISSSALFHRKEGKQERPDDSPKATRLISGQSPVWKPSLHLTPFDKVQNVVEWIPAAS